MPLATVKRRIIRISIVGDMRRKCQCSSGGFGLDVLVSSIDEKQAMSNQAIGGIIISIDGMEFCI